MRNRQCHNGLLLQAGPKFESFVLIKHQSEFVSFKLNLVLIGRSLLQNRSKGKRESLIYLLLITTQTTPTFKLNRRLQPSVNFYQPTGPLQTKREMKQAQIVPGTILCQNSKLRKFPYRERVLLLKNSSLDIFQLKSHITLKAKGTV